MSSTLILWCNWYGVQPMHKNDHKVCQMILLCSEVCEPLQGTNSIKAVPTVHQPTQTFGAMLITLAWRSLKLDGDLIARATNLFSSLLFPGWQEGMQSNMEKKQKKIDLSCKWLKFDLLETLDQCSKKDFQMLEVTWRLSNASDRSQ